MFDILIETTAAFLATFVFFTILKGTQHNIIRQQPGVRLIVIGFGLLLFSLIIDITDNFPSLNSLVIVGDTEFQAFLEKVVGTLLGFFIMSVGFRRWLPSIQELVDTRQSLDKLTVDLDLRVKQRSEELVKINNKLKSEILERNKAEVELKHQAMHDTLTKLPNRSALIDVLEQEISRASHHDYFSAVLFLDLDNFKQINDLLGHETGDQVLQITTDRLNRCIRKEDFIGRLGGDEFVLILTELHSEVQIAAEMAQTIAQNIITALNEPIRIADHKLSASSCIGIKLFPDTKDETVGDLLRQADTALYHAKNLASGTFSFFHDDMQRLIEQRVNLARELHEALEQKQFYLHYQPQMNSKKEVVGVEALLRWNHPTRDYIGPEEFIPIAEEAGLINKIGRYVLRQALTECSNLFTDIERQKKLKIAVNISPSHFLQSNFVEQIKTILDSFKQHHFHLVLEVTESVVIQDIDNVSNKMETLRQLGVGISLDDFGTGYSSLNYIKRLPFDALKIDRSFILDILDDPHDEAIVEAILAMTASLGVNVIAEGVETQEQCDFLTQRGCKLFQGYLFSRPDLISELIKKKMFD